MSYLVPVPRNTQEGQQAWLPQARTRVQLCPLSAGPATLLHASTMHVFVLNPITGPLPLLAFLCFTWVEEWVPQRVCRGQAATLWRLLGLSPSCGFQEQSPG